MISLAGVSGLGQPFRSAKIAAAEKGRFFPMNRFRIHLKISAKGAVSMINVIASIKVKEGRVAEFIDIFKKNVPNVLVEKGCLGYVPTVDQPSGLPPQELDGNMVTILEKWESLDALKDHLAAPHMLSYREQVKDIVENLTIKILKEV